MRTVLRLILGVVLGTGALLLGACGSSRAARADDAGDAPVISADAERTADDRIDQARRALADDKPDDARRILDVWLEEPGARRRPRYAEALYLRGNAKVAQGREYSALYDYEEVIKNHAGSEFFALALEREFEIAKDYLAGKRIRILGMRLESGVSEAEEILTRINERLPGSRLAERALLELGDHYYRTRDLKMAVEVYDVFLRVFPRSEHRSMAMQRRAFANIAQFRGPSHDARGLVEAKFQIEQFQQEYPLDAERVGMSDALQARLDESVAEQMLVTARWHLSRNDEASGRYVLARLITTHPETGAARDAIDIMQRNNWPLPGTPADAPGGGQ